MFENSSVEASFLVLISFSISRVQISFYPPIIKMIVVNEGSVSVREERRCGMMKLLVISSLQCGSCDL